MERRLRLLPGVAAVGVDLDAYAGGQVEISISYASDWATQGLGVFVDDMSLPDGSGSTSFEGDADPMAAGR